MMKHWSTITILICSIQSASFSFATAQDSNNVCKGKTVADCAQTMVLIANKLVDENKDLAKRISNIENDLKTYKSLNDAAVKSATQQIADGKTGATDSAPTVAFWEKNSLTIISGPLKLTAQAVGPEGPAGWAALHVNYGKTFKSNPVVVSSTGFWKDSTAGNIFDVRLDHFAIYIRTLPNGAADPGNTPLYFVIFPPAD